jgi:3-deoxy-manno-octulosonate cytidylyltransferase (CMP-KDO synthetase)
MTFKVVIPARHASTRLMGKPLLEIAGRPMIQWVIAAARGSQAEEVWVATDDERIRDASAPNAVMTRSDHASGTDRIAEVAVSKGWPDDAIVVNVQGDEPQLSPLLIDQVATLLDHHAEAAIATLCTPIESLQEFLNPNAVKVVFGHDQTALYFSRAPIPWAREGALANTPSQTQYAHAYRHLGIYAYRVAALRRLTSMPPSELEEIEKLEQLRALQSGMRVVVAVASSRPPPGVDTLEDLERVRATFAHVPHI